MYNVTELCKTAIWIQQHCGALMSGQGHYESDIIVMCTDELD